MNGRMERGRRILGAGTVAVLSVLGGCQSGAPSGPPPPEPVGRIVFVVDHPNTPNPSEQRIRDRVSALAPGIPVVLINDEDFVPSDTEGCRMVLMSKTVEDSTMGNKLKGCTCGLFFWEENQQMLSMLATIDNDGSDGGFWHKPGQVIWVRPEAPAVVRDGLSGEITFYNSVQEISYGRREDVPAQATVIAEYEEPGDHKVIYYFERGQTLADGTPAAGKRFYFGIHRDTFIYLTPEALRLFDAGIRWTLAE